VEKAEEAEERAKLGQAALEALQQLPFIQRDLLVLRYVFNCSEKEAAAELEITLGAARAHLTRARRHLRDLLRRRGEDGTGPAPPEGI
jgi:RNA polymerase sigma factor (sigma-70 family)